MKELKMENVKKTVIKTANKLILITLFALPLVAFQGCIVVEKMQYSIKITDDTKGIATIKITDIKSNAIGNKEFEEDNEALLNYIYQSKDFITDMEQEGKEIVKRELVVEGDKLNGVAEYKFNDISKVEGIQYSDGLYYLTLELGDSVLATNGKVITSEEYKRIIWDSTFSTLEFTLYAAAPEQTFRSFIPELNKLKK